MDDTPSAYHGGQVSTQPPAPAYDQSAGSNHVVVRFDWRGGSTRAYLSGSGHLIDRALWKRYTQARALMEELSDEIERAPWIDYGQQRDGGPPQEDNGA